MDSKAKLLPNEAVWSKGQDKIGKKKEIPVLNVYAQVLLIFVTIRQFRTFTICQITFKTPAWSVGRVSLLIVGSWRHEDQSGARQERRQAHGIPTVMLLRLPSWNRHRIDSWHDGAGYDSL